MVHVNTARSVNFVPWTVVCFFVIVHLSEVWVGLCQLIELLKWIALMGASQNSYFVSNIRIFLLQQIYRDIEWILHFPIWYSARSVTLPGSSFCSIKNLRFSHKLCNFMGRYNSLRKTVAIWNYHAVRDFSSQLSS